MTVSEYESRLKAVNPNLSIKRTGAGLQAIFHKGKFVCRIATREITPHDVSIVTQDHAKSQESLLNPGGAYSWKKLLHRGRRNTARILYQERLIQHGDIAKIS